MMLNIPKGLPEKYDFSIIVSGNIVQLREFERLQKQKGEEKAIKSRCKAETSDEDKAEGIKASERRAKDILMRKLNSNFGFAPRDFYQDGKSLKFLTLTYKENMQDRKRLSHDWALFIKRIEYRQGEKIEYCCVPEKQKRGAYHIHALLHSSYIPLANLIANWNKERHLGGVFINICNDPCNVGRYIGKYIGKDFSDSTEITRGVNPSKNKRFYTSRGLKDLSTRVTGYSKTQNLQKFKDLMKMESEYIRDARYDSEWTGVIKFQEYSFAPDLVNKSVIQEGLFQLYPPR